MYSSENVQRNISIFTVSYIYYLDAWDNVYIRHARMDGLTKVSYFTSINVYLHYYYCGYIR